MGRKANLSILAAGLVLSLACDLIIRPPTPTAAPTPTLPDTATPTLTPSSTLTPLPTRTASPTLIPGIEEPVQIGEANLQVTKALRRDIFRCGEESEPPGDPEAEEFLIVLWKVFKGPSLNTAQLKKWIQDNDIDRIQLDFRISSGRGSVETALYICYKRDPDSYRLTEIHMAYPIDIRAETFFLILPDGKIIPLESLIAS